MNMNTTSGVASSRASAAPSSQRPRTAKSSSRRYERKKQPSSWSLREKILLQTLVCGIFIAIVLFINLFDNSFANNATSWVKKTISANSGLEGLNETARAAGAGIESAYNKILGFITGNPEVKETFSQNPPKAQENTINTNTVPQTEDTSNTSFETIPNPSVSETRVDEDMLNEINSRSDPYTQKK